MGSTDPGPPVHPQLGHLPAPAAARPSLPRCLAGQAWPCASCNTWSHCTNHLTESLCCYLTLQREVLPQAGRHDQGLPGENREPAPCPQGACTAQSGTLDRGALAQSRAGPAVETSWGWDLRPWHCKQLSTKEKTLCSYIQAHEGTSYSHLRACEPPRAVFVLVHIPCQVHGCAWGMHNWGFYHLQSLKSVLSLSLFKDFIKGFIYLFLERRREKKRERNIDVQFPIMHLDWESNQQPSSHSRFAGLCSIH